MKNGLEPQNSSAEYPSHPSGKIDDSRGLIQHKLNPRPRKRPSRRQCLAATHLVAGATKTEALRKAGYSEEYARARQREFFDRPLVRVAIGEALARAGITPDFIAAVIAEGLEAVTPVALGHSEPDHRMRLRYLETAARLLCGRD